MSKRRVGVRRGRPPVPQAGEPAGPVTLDDIYARHTPIAWWDGAHGLGAGTWTDRVSGRVLTAAAGIALASGTLSARAAAVITSDGSGAGLDTPASAALASPDVRVFAAFSVAVSGSDSAQLYWLQIDGDGLGLYPWQEGASGLYAYAGDGVDYTERTGSSAGDGLAHVTQQEFGGTHASHRVWLDETEQTAAVGTADPAISAATGLLTVGTSNVGPLDITIGMIAVYALSEMDDIEAAQLRTDLLGWF